jgi:hypothetical protein
LNNQYTAQNLGLTLVLAFCVQLWIPLMSWYAENRRSIEEQVKKYSDPPSEHLLPDLPPHAR